MSDRPNYELSDLELSEKIARLQGYKWQIWKVHPTDLFGHKNHRFGLDDPNWTNLEEKPGDLSDKDWDDYVNQVPNYAYRLSANEDIINALTAQLTSQNMEITFCISRESAMACIHKAGVVAMYFYSVRLDDRADIDNSMARAFCLAYLAYVEGKK